MTTPPHNCFLFIFFVYSQTNLEPGDGWEKDCKFRWTDRLQIPMDGPTKLTVTGLQRDWHEWQDGGTDGWLDGTDGIGGIDATDGSDGIDGTNMTDWNRTLKTPGNIYRYPGNLFYNSKDRNQIAYFSRPFHYGAK